MDLEVLKNLSILYVEDEMELKKVTADFLSNVIGNVVSVNNGLDALEQFNHEKYNVVITDINMPKLNGVELIKELKKMNKDIPIIVTTAYNNEKQIDELYEAGMNEYLMKPIDLMELVEKIYSNAKSSST
jgi:CheY-like chemotaxis protein